MKTNNLEVSLVKELCPVCCKEMNGPIIMNSILTEKNAKNVKDLHNKVIGFADHCCEECSKYKDEVVKKEADIIESFKDYIIIIKDGTQIVFIDEETGKNLGIFKDA